MTKHKFHSTVLTIALVSGVSALARPVPANAIVLPDGFVAETVASGFVNPLDIDFAPNERIFVAEQRGQVWIIDNGIRLPDPFIDLVDEVGNAGDRGLLGIALDPDFETTPWVYLLYVVDPIPGRPDEPSVASTFGRLTRYQADSATGGNTALLSSRQVLVGVKPDEGFIHCYASHAIGTIRFGNDGTLFAGAGDGAHYTIVDVGGNDPTCFGDPLFDPIHDIGAFRSQFLGSLAGKIIRIDPETGEGLPSNPFWTGNPQDTRSKVWVSGLRNPFRFALRPGHGTPETLYIGDVGWHLWEELDVAHGGENFGWPCYEGVGAQGSYFDQTPAHSGCDTIETPENPGPLTPPVITWHHLDDSVSIPPGFEGRCAVGGPFYTGHCYPPEYRGRVFFADYSNSWINVLEVDDDDNLVSLNTFATEAASPVSIEVHPITGDLYYVSISTGEVRRIYYEQPPADTDHDCDIDLADFHVLQVCFTGEGSPLTAGCEGLDSDGDNDIDLMDFDAFQQDFTGPL